MTAFEFLAYLRRLEVKVWAEGDQLRVRGPKEVLTPAVRADLAHHKAELLTLLQQARLSSQPAAPPLRSLAREQSALPLSFAQERLWFIDALQPGSAVYNITGTLRLRGTLQLGALWRSLSTVVVRQATLRTSFPTCEERPVQWIAPAAPLPLPVVDLRALPLDTREAALEQFMLAAARQPFELARGPLVRVRLFRLDTTEHVLFTVMHHIISDGWSNTVFANEMLALYPALAAGRPSPLPPLPVQYADYAIWQRTWLQGDKETRRQGDKEQETSDPLSQPAPCATLVPHPSPPPALRLSPIEAQLAYWQAQLKDAPTMLALPTDRPRLPVQTDHGTVHPLTLPAGLTTALRALSQQEHATLFMTLLAAFVTLLYRYSGQEDLVAGTAVAGRTHPELEGLIGFFINTLALRADLSGNPPFRTLLQRMRAVTLSAFAHQDLPFAKLVEELQPTRDLGHTPLFQIIFMLQNFPAPALDTPDLQIEVINVNNRTAKFDLTLTLGEDEHGLRGMFEYNTDLFDESTIVRMTTHLQTLLAGIIAHPEQPIAGLNIMTDAEWRQLISWNVAERTCPPQHCIHQLFAAQVAQTPDAVALVFDDRRPTTDDRRPTTDDRSPLHPFTPSPLHPLTCQHLTYAQLNQRANQLAHYLQGLEVGPEVRVGLCMERSLDLVVGLLGVLKAGGAYVPLDPAHPEARLAFMLEDAQVAVLLTTNDQRPTTNDRSTTNEHPFTPSPLHPFTPSGSVVDLRADWPKIALLCRENPASVVRADHLAYLIYTSGSTGRPKAVEVEHRNLVNVLCASQARFEFRSDLVMPWIASVSFDIALFELLSPLLAGGTSVVLSEQYILDPPRLLAKLAHCTALHSVPSLMRQVVRAIGADGQEPQAYDHIRMVFVGGELVPLDLLADLRAVFRKAAIYVLYGPTEGTIICTYYVVPQDLHAEWHVIGRPLDNIQVRLCDQQGQPVPVGALGEIYLGGAGVTRGYLNRPDLTAERFIPNPFAEVLGDGCWVLENAAPNTQHPTPNTRLYKTGDRARYLPDGRLVFLGRLDEQVKVRGFRIEPGEVAAVLGQHPAVHECVVVAREDVPGSKRLVAYVVPKIEDRGLKIEDSGSSAPEPLSSILYPLSSELRDFLKDKLPDYMVPAVFVTLDALPLTPNNKIDRNALPAPDTTRPELEVAFAAPRTDIERVLAEIWADILGLEQVGIHDNFFDLGGHSLLSTQVISRVRAALRIELPLRELFAAPTVAGLAERIEMLRWAAQAQSGPTHTRAGARQAGRL